MDRTLSSTRDQRGAVTAETALMLPLLAIFAMAMAWLICLGVVAVKAQDAAREAARVLARGDSVAAGTGYADRIAPAGSRVQIDREDGSVTVVVTARVRGPHGMFAFLPQVDIHGRAVAAMEAGVGP